MLRLYDTVLVLGLKNHPTKVRTVAYSWMMTITMAPPGPNMVYLDHLKIKTRVFCDIGNLNEYLETLLMLRLPSKEFLITTHYR